MSPAVCSCCSPLLSARICHTNWVFRPGLRGASRSRTYYLLAFQVRSSLDCLQHSTLCTCQLTRLLTCSATRQAGSAWRSRVCHENYSLKDQYSSIRSGRWFEKCATSHCPGARGLAAESNQCMPASMSEGQAQMSLWPKGRR